MHPYESRSRASGNSRPNYRSWRSFYLLATEVIIKIDALGTCLRAPTAREPPPGDARWNRSLPARLVRDFSHATCFNWFTHTFARMRVDGLEHLRTLSPPVIFAANHQSHFDTPVLFAALPRRWRRRLAPLMLKDYFHAHFH